MKSVELSIVVPVRNEEGQLLPFVNAVAAVLSGVDFEIIFVEDGSTDDTWRAIRDLATADAKVGGIRLSRNFGKEAALWSGIETATGAAVLVMDVDLQHPPQLIPRMLELWRSGSAKIVEATKQRRSKEPLWYRLLSRVFCAILKRGTGIDFVGSTDFKLLDRSVVDVLKTLPERVTFFRGICSWTGFDRTSVEFEVPETTRPTRWNFFRLVRLSVDAITSFTPWPLFIVAAGGVAFAGFALILGIQTLYMYLSHRALTGFTTVILLVLIVGAGIMFGLTILGLYVSRLFDEVKARPRALSVDTIRPRSQ
jgi:glycosyltransferase involved in cell wall biosynthesis